MLESLKERNLAFLKPRFHKPGLELLLRKNVFSSECSDIVEDHLTSMNLNLAQANNPRKIKRTGGTQMKLETAFSKGKKINPDSDDGGDSDSSETSSSSPN